MKNIEIDEALYQYIATNTQYIGESASSILRRLLKIELGSKKEVVSINDNVDGEVEVEVSTNNPTHVEQEQISTGSKDNVVEKETESAEYESVFNFINKEELSMQRGAVGRFLLILAALYRAHPEQFSVVTDISGRDRLYFANSENELAASGSSTKPRQIPDSPFWVITNSNTTRKKMMLTKASVSLGYSESDVEKIRELL